MDETKKFTPCPWCVDEPPTTTQGDCDKHCLENQGRPHEVAREITHIEDGIDVMMLDIYCTYCGRPGSAPLHKPEILW